MNTPQPPVIDAPPLLPPEPQNKPDSFHRLIALLLSLCLGLFVIDALLSAADDFAILMLDNHALSSFRGLVGLAAILLCAVVYGCMALTPLIPKRLFLPIALFNPATLLIAIPPMIYCYSRMQQVALAISICQVVIGLLVLWRCQSGSKFQWLLVPMYKLGTQTFNWKNLAGFMLVNVFILAPLVFVYLFIFISLAVGHFTGGFMALRPSGLVVQERKYVRDDGKSIQLFPMSHVADPDFYQNVSRSIPTNALILMEGVSDDQNLLTNKITYKRMAKSLGLAEQKETFVPGKEQIVRADVDVGQFSKPTLDFLNLVMMIHSRGLTLANVGLLLQNPPQQHFETQLFDDILNKRNQHLLEEIHSHLPESDTLVVPWGVAHMPGVSAGIQKEGFHVQETNEYYVIRFHKKKNADASK